MKRYDFDLTVYKKLYIQKETHRKIAKSVKCSQSTISYRRKDFEMIHVLIKILNPSVDYLVEILSRNSSLKNYADDELCEIMINHISKKE